MLLEKMEGVSRLVWARLILRRSARSEVHRHWSGQRGTARTPTTGELQTAIRLAGLIARIARRLPLNFNCLAQSLALAAMLRRRSIPARVEFGVRKKSENGELAAHAWVTCGDRVILDSDSGSDYVPFERRSG